MNNDTKNITPNEPLKRKKATERLVVIGSNAGGIEALQQFFSYLPKEKSLPYTFVLIHHLSPFSKSYMPNIIQKETTLPVELIQDNSPLLEGYIYLIPTGTTAKVIEGIFKLEHRVDAKQPHHPIDIFMRSAAAYYKEKNTVIIMSGSGEDGKEGVIETKKYGGTVMIQLLDDGMPRAALDTKIADHLLPVELLALELYNKLNNPHIKSIKEQKQQFKVEETFRDILKLIQNHTGNNFNYYLQRNLYRRFQEIIKRKKLASSEHYLRYLKNDPNEVLLLEKHLLIGVTSFFRDLDVWEYLASHIIPSVVDKHIASDDEIIKVWCAGISTGEEAYSIAILLKEEIKKRHLEKSLSIKIFATDLNKESLITARDGVYSKEHIEQLPFLIKNEYFNQNSSGQFEVKEDLRTQIIFSEHNIISQPPFSKMDMVFCRNLLIYLNPSAQQIALERLHYSLKVNGYLVLGKSENIDSIKTGVQEISTGLNIFKNINGAPILGHKQLSPTRKFDLRPVTSSNKMKHELEMFENISSDLIEMINGVVIKIDNNGNILHSIGNLSRFISLKEKGFSVNLFELLPESLNLQIQSLFFEVNKTRTKAELETYFSNPQQPRIKLKVQIKKINSTHKQGVLYLIFLIPSTDYAESPIHQIQQDESTQQINQLNNELTLLRKRMNEIIAKELINHEKLQITNEELESSNEELQSLNEELYTVNAEHQYKVSQLSELNAEVSNLLKSTEIGTIFLDKNMCILKFTPAIQQQFHLTENDIGRPIFHFTSSFKTKYNKVFIESISKVISEGSPQQHEFQNQTGKWFLNRSMPFIDEEGRREGVVISFIDIDSQKKVEEKYLRQKIAFEQILEETMAGYWEMNLNKNTLTTSHTFKKMLGKHHDEEFTNLDDWTSYVHEEDTSKLQEIFKWTKHDREKSVEIRFYDSEGAIIYTYCKCKVVERDVEEKAIRIIGSIVDITWLHEKHKLEKKNEELKQFAYVASHDLQEPLRTISTIAERMKVEYENQLDKKADIYLGFLMQAVNRMSTLIKDLLSYSRLGRNNKLTTISPHTIVQEVSKDLEQLIGELDAKIIIEKLPLKIKAYETEFRQLIQNLLSNALKFHKPNTKPRVIIRGKEANRYYHFSIEDNGIGISKEYQDKIFLVFQRLHTQDEYEGSGIGLSSCQKIVEFHGGSIRVSSKVGEGSTFHFSIKK